MIRADRDRNPAKKKFRGMRYPLIDQGDLNRSGKSCQHQRLEVIEWKKTENIYRDR